MPIPSIFQCPVCSGELAFHPGTQLNAKDGVTIYCPHRTCPAQEVSGHGSNEKQAYEVVSQKFSHRQEK